MVFKRYLNTIYVFLRGKITKLIDITKIIFKNL